MLEKPRKSSLETEEDYSIIDQVVLMLPMIMPDTHAHRTVIVLQNVIKPQS
jgi:hypothetical protein